MWKISKILKTALLLAFFKECFGYLLREFGWSTLVMAGVLALATSGITYLSNLKPIISFLAGLFCFAVLLAIFALIRHLKTNPKAKIAEPQKKDTIDLGVINDESLILDLSQASSFRAHLDSNCVFSIKASSEQTQRFQLFISGLKKHSLGFEAKLQFPNNFYKSLVKSDSGEGYIFGFSNDSGRTFILSSQAEGHIGAVETFIKLIPDRLVAHGEYMESSNISSVTDDGVGKFTFTFVEPIDPNFTIRAEGNKNIEFKLLSKTKSSVKIHFYGDEPEIVKLVFE